MKRHFLYFIISLFASVLFLMTLPVSGSADNSRIIDGVYAGNIPLGGMTSGEAEATVNKVISELSGRTITLITVNDEEVTVTPSEMGFCWSNPEIIKEAVALGNSGNVVSRYKEKKRLQYMNQIYPIEYGVNNDKIKAILEEKCATFDNEAQNGELVFEDGQFIINQGVNGAVLDVEASVEKLADYMTKEWTGENTSFQLVVNVDDPEGTYEELSLVKDVLGTFHTDFKSSGANRSANVRNGARLINGSIIYPGEEYSFYDHIKPFTKANGYEIGAAYSGGKVVDSIGGGICQVSSTLYNSVLYAELEVTERKNHAMIVGYVSPGRDATIAEASGIDFKFVNNTDAPIYIEAHTTEDKQLYITIYGHETRSKDRVVEYESEVLSKTVPEGEDIFPDSSKPVGLIEVQSAHIGYTANLWKVVTENGETTRELVNYSVYKPAKKYAIVGTATDNAAARSTIEAAIASGSIANVKNAIANIKNGNYSTGPSQEELLAMYEEALKRMEGEG